MSVSRQARLLGISRGSVYYQRRPPSTADLALMRRIDALHLIPLPAHHFEAGKRLHENLSEEEKEVFATEFWKCLFDKIKFLYKSRHYRGEEEYRYVVIRSAQDGQHVEIKYDFRSAGPYLRGYIEVPELKADEILLSGNKICTVFIGPRVEYRNRLCRNLKQIADNVELMGLAFRPSEIPYRKAW